MLFFCFTYFCIFILNAFDATENSKQTIKIPGCIHCPHPVHLF